MRINPDISAGWRIKEKLWCRAETGDSSSSGDKMESGFPIDGFVNADTGETMVVSEKSEGGGISRLGRLNEGR